MTIEKLTGRQRHIIEVCHSCDGVDALRIIDAQAAEIERLRADREQGLDFAAETGVELGALKQESALQRKLAGGFSQALMAAEARLAEATARLAAVQSWLDVPGRDEGERMFVELRGILAGQPAAPARGEAVSVKSLGRLPEEAPDMKKREAGCECHLEEGDSPCVVHGLYEAEAPAAPDTYERGIRDERGVIIRPEPAAPARTEADQAVLDAMGEVDEDTLRDRLDFKRLSLEDRAVYRAELARRRLK